MKTGITTLEMASPVYTEEQLNYFRICYIATDVLPKGLRSIFKQEWDSRYKAWRGEWNDSPKNGLDFKNLETPSKIRTNAQLWATMKNGNRAEWDCTMLFYAILFSDSIKRAKKLPAVIYSSINDLRNFRNKDFAHMPQGQLSDKDFNVAVQKVNVAFQTLGLSTVEIQTLVKQKSFPTNELTNVLAKVHTLNQELQRTDAKLQATEEQCQVLEQQLQHEIESFCVLPPKPPHQIAGREGEVAAIESEMNNLKKTSGGSVSYYYVSGNPGSGKSQLAGLVAKKFYDKATNDPITLSFVMTLNAENSESLLDSYVSLARKVGCPEYAITNTQMSKDLKTEAKLTNLRDLIATKIHFYTSWLLVVDNVTSLSGTHDFLPELGNEQWGKGQLLITTHDSLCIPSDSPFISHTSINKGMPPKDATCFLSMASGISDQGMEDKVAKKLDYQPLALANAATYMKKVCITSPNLGWKEYLEKLKKGKHGLIENDLAKTNPSYPKAMTVTTRIAVERDMNSDELMRHAFTFFALCSPQPVRLDILTNYILNYVGEDYDKEDIGIHIQGSSLVVIESEQNVVYVRCHQVVHKVIKLVLKGCMDTDAHARAVDAAVKSFIKFIDETIPEVWNELDSIAETRHFIQHLKSLVAQIGIVADLATKEKNQFFSGILVNASDYSYQLMMLGQICHNHSDLISAKEYYTAARTLLVNSEKSDDEVVAQLYGCLGRVNTDLRNLSEASKCLECAHCIFIKTLGPENANVADMEIELGNVQRRLGNNQKANQHYEDALSFQLKTYGPNDSDVASAYIGLSNVESVLGDWKQAKEHLNHALSINMNKFGHEHVEVGRVYHDLGVVHSLSGNHQLGKENFENAQSIFLQRLGPNHVLVASAYYNLGVLYKELGSYNEAKEVFELALSIYRKKLGREHSDFVKTHFLLHVVKRHLGGLQLPEDLNDPTLSMVSKAALHIQPTCKRKIAYNCNNLKYKCSKQRKWHSI